MRTNEAHIFVFIACIIIGILISMNIDFKKSGTSTFLTANQYQDAYSERSKLYGEIGDLQKQYNKYHFKLSKYKNSEESRYEIISELEKELEENKTKLGMSDAEGEGITLTLSDATDEYNSSGNETYLIHFYDIMFLINDLKNAGAEAISVNGQRVVDSTYEYCGGVNININGVKVVTPFYISAIGNKEVMKKYMLMDENYLKYLTIVRKIKFDIEIEDNIKISSYIGNKNYKYARSKIKN